MTSQKQLKICRALCVSALLLCVNTAHARTHNRQPETGRAPTVANSTSAKVRRIRFKPGETAAQTTGHLDGWNNKAHFVIRLRAGQTMHISVEGKCDDCYPDVSVDSPPGAHDTMDPDMCQCLVEVTNTAAGDYRITVGENRKGGPWKGAFVLNIEVK